MVQARYSFGLVSKVDCYRDFSLLMPHRYFGVIVACILNLIGMCGFCILNCILGGQTLAAVADNNLSWTCVSIIVIGDNSSCLRVLAVSELSSFLSYHFWYVLVHIFMSLMSPINFSCRYPSAATKFSIGTNDWPGFPS